MSPPLSVQELATRIREAIACDEKTPEGRTSLTRDLLPFLRSALDGAPPDLQQLMGKVADNIDRGQHYDALLPHLRELAEAIEGRDTEEPLDGLIDEAVIRGFLDDRWDSVEELETHALEVEHSGDAESLDAIRRTIHSIKGDSSLLGLDELCRLCHELEDELEEVDAATAGRLTLQAVEHMRKCFEAVAERVGRGGSQPDPAGTAEQSAEPLPNGDVPDLSGADSVPDLEPDHLAEADQELTVEFVSEAREHLESIDASLLILDGNDVEKREEAVNAVFRAFHTLKGLSGFLNLKILMSITHEAETMLDRVRSDELELSPFVIDTTFKIADAIKITVAAVEASLVSGQPVFPPSNYRALMAMLSDASSGRRQSPKTAEAPSPSAPVREPAKPVDSKPEPSGGAASPQPIQSTIKVDAARLDHLVDTIGELVIAEAMVSQCEEVNRHENSRLLSLLGQLDKTTRELQEMAMSLRMVPIRSTFRRMARLARDVARKVGKNIEFVTRGDDTELDKTVVDVIGDPLVHMVRNAIDHGIERSAEDRLTAGKPAAGRVELRAFHQGGCIHVEIEDDGRGLDREAILRKARSRGIVSDGGENLSDSEVFGLIFAPGFSTADQVTQVSGRGVGLDVVRRNIEGLRGRIEIQSDVGKGSIFSIRLPLTLAIIDGMVVRVAEQRYIVPTLSIIRMFRPKSAELIKVLDRGSVLEVGNELVSLHRLDEVFQLKRSSLDLTEMSAVVLESAKGPFAFLVDELLGQQQIVIKPLGETLKGISGFAGGAVMPDGTVGLILDVAGLVDLVSSYSNTNAPESSGTADHVTAEFSHSQ